MKTQILMVRACSKTIDGRDASPRRPRTARRAVPTPEGKFGLLGQALVRDLRTRVCLGCKRALVITGRLTIAWLALATVAVSNAEPSNHPAAEPTSQKQDQAPAKDTPQGTETTFPRAGGSAPKGLRPGGKGTATPAQEYQARLHARVQKEVPKLPLPKTDHHATAGKQSSIGEQGAARGARPEIREPGSFGVSKQQPVIVSHQDGREIARPVSTAPLNGSALYTHNQRTRPAFIGGAITTAPQYGGGLSGTGMTHKRYP